LFRQLDDVEFDIPAVATPPSLESILNEQDDHSDAEELNLIAEVCHILVIIKGYYFKIEV
jgi:hypothetical protein